MFCLLVFCMFFVYCANLSNRTKKAEQLFSFFHFHTVHWILLPQMKIMHYGLRLYYLFFLNMITLYDYVYLIFLAMCACKSLKP